MENRVKRTKKNVIKNLVKENQRIHDYDSPFGVRFWNKILKDSKAFSRNNKVFDRNIPTVIERAYDRYRKALKTETDSLKKYELEQFLFQLEYFMTEEWRTLFNDDARLKEGKEKIIWKNRCPVELKEYYTQRKIQRRKEHELKNANSITNSEKRKS
nr:MAG TPA: hypothetical protein [Caudoviricetes sp.]